MQFVVVDGSWPVVPCAIPRSQLLARSVKDTDHGEDGVGQSVLPGRALFTLCQEVLDTSASKTKAPPELATLDMTFLRDPQTGPLGALRLYTFKSVSHQFFAVEDLVSSGCLIVFTSHWASLTSAALLTGVRTTHKEKDNPAKSSRRRIENKTGSGTREVSASRASSLMGRGRSVLQKFSRAETYFTSVASATQRDFEMVNELLLSGTIRMNARLESFLCSVCGNLPRRTMTTSCCGAVVCLLCAPTLSSSSVLREEVVCAVCGEMPLTNPEAHVSRDAEVMRLVRELRVLYHPQVSAAACRAMPGETQPPPTPFNVHHAGLPVPICDMNEPTGSVLGSVFMGPS
ncbi:hypothetical protein C3747_169g93 [Trypanosoma cruzi]|uniref:Uncharacterized protein n=1 Tax=Trypanosoma cruzi TaxID=5693 RepID=A0A2V2W7S9_TRYCR|nr:hypothetical protein TcYC6_0016300 [Trypanosoma cruzi]PWV03763.1 hypothetical protein C3747_169g93 [Trypanosoma cruzi]